MTPRRPARRPGLVPPTAGGDGEHASPVRLVSPPPPAAWIVEAVSPLPRRVEELGRDCLETASVDAVHDLRVATRRLREALRLFGPWLPEKDVARLRRRLRRITRGLGPVRNQDVALEFYAASPAPGGADWPAGTRDARAWVVRRCAQERLAALPAMQRLLKRARCARVRPEVDAMLAACAEIMPPQTESPFDTRSGGGVQPYLPAPGWLAAVALRQRFDEILIHRDAMPGEGVPPGGDEGWIEPMHRVRIGLKKLRYTLELLRPADPRAIESSLRRLKALQDEFGLLQDLVTFERMLRPGTPESLWPGWVPASRASGIQTLSGFLAARAGRQAGKAASAFRRQFLGVIRPSLVLRFPGLAD